MLNTIMLMGRLTRDPKIKTSENGTKYLNYTIAVDRDFPSKEGEKVTDFLPAIAWEMKAEVISRYFKKGSRIAVQGRLETDSYTGADGKTVKSFVIVTEKLYFVDSKPKDSKPKSDGFRTDDGIPF